MWNSNLLCLTLYCLVLVVWCNNETNSTTSPFTSAIPEPWSVNASCHDVYKVNKGLQCEFIEHVLDCEASSKIDYLRLPYCYLNGLSGISVLLFLFWVVFLYLNLALVIDTRIIPNLQTISKALHMSDGLAGVTLLAFGNGAADIFGAVAAVKSSEEGGVLALAGLLGGGLFTTTVVSGLVIFSFQPKVQLHKLGRDVLFYLVAVGWVTFMLVDKEITVGEGLMFLVIYIVFVIVVVCMETLAPVPFVRHPNSKSKESPEIHSLESTPLIKLEKTASSPALSEYSEGSEEEVVDMLERCRTYSFVTHPMLDYDKDFQHISDAADPQTVRSILTRIMRWGGAPTVKPAHGSIRYTLSRVDPLAFEEEPWAERSFVGKVATVLQLPCRVILYFTCPVVYPEEPGRSWDRNLYIFLFILSAPLTLVLINEDAFFSNEQDGIESVPAVLYAVVVGILISVLVGATSSWVLPPVYNKVFAVWGFVVSLVFVYVIADEIVAVVRTVGVVLDLSLSTVGFLMMGFGNGTCDLIANWLVASQGFPNVAMAAIYAGPVLNTFVGLALAAVVWHINYSGPYRVASDFQLYMGISVLITEVLTTFTLREVLGRLPRLYGLALITLYVVFLCTSIGLEASRKF
eukprot:m.52517 g.52517  ORF g.52517 m.52517 type:complete len:631 (-) comp10798_c0_seq1:2310-4202(-)